MNTEHLDLFKNKAGETDEVFGENAHKYIKSGTDVLLDVIKTTLGPKGSMKILQGKGHAVTNDGAFILSNLQIEAPSARVLIDSSKTQDYEEGDGTTSIALMAALIVKFAHESKVRPAAIVKGLKHAMVKIDEILNFKKIQATKTDIENMVMTTLNSKVLNSNIQMFTKICVDAIDNLDDACDLNLINIIKVHGDLSESKLVSGLIIDKPINMATKACPIENPKVLVINSALDFDKIKVFSSKIAVNSIKELEEVENAEKERMRQKINGICALDFDVIVNRQIIYDYPMQLLLSKGKHVIENADFDNVEKLNKVLGGQIVSHFFEKHNQAETVGKCGAIETITVKDKVLTKFSGAGKGASTILLHGSSQAILNEAERSIHDALCVLKQVEQSGHVLYGGGNVEVMLSLELLKYSQEIKTLESEGPLVFSKALMEFVEILCTNCGFDSSTFKSAITSMYNVRSTYQKNNFTQGLNVTNGQPGDMKGLKIMEGFSMKLRVLKAACETAQSLLRCDGVITHPPRERHRH